MGAEHVERRGAQLENRTTRIEGKLDTIAVQIEANAVQRERMEDTLLRIEAHLRELNGRTGKSEIAIVELKLQSRLLEDLARALKTQPDGTLQVITPPAEPEERPSLTKTQKTAAGGLGVVIVLGLIEILKHTIDLGMAIVAKR